MAYGYYTDGKLFQLLDRVRNVLQETHYEVGAEAERQRVFTETGPIKDLVMSKRNLLGWVGEQRDTHFAVLNYYDVNGNKRTMLIHCRNPEYLNYSTVTHDEQVLRLRLMVEQSPHAPVVEPMANSLGTQKHTTPVYKRRRGKPSH